MHLEQLTKIDIELMNFSELVGIVREPNRPSGGAKTIREIIHNSFIFTHPNPDILEIGSNTGFSSNEFASWLPSAHIYGIDVNPISVEFSKEKALDFKLNNTTFILGDGRGLPFENSFFDLIFASNTTSFIKEKHSVVQECYRVLKPNGILSIAPIYYRSMPPEALIKEVEKAIGTSLDITTKTSWEKLFLHPNSSLVYSSDHTYINISEEEIDQYTTYVMSQPHLEKIESKLKQQLSEKLKYFYMLFNENLCYCGYSVMLYRMNYINSEPELYITK